jgi:hypothetical protein
MGERARRPALRGRDASRGGLGTLALANLLAPALERPVVVAHVHPWGRLSRFLSEGEYEALVREVAESTFEQVREYPPSVPERRMQPVSERSPAAGLDALAQRDGRR